MEFVKKPKNQQEAAELRKQSKKMLTIAGVLLAITILWVIASGGAPKFLVLLVGIFGGLGLVQRYGVSKAEKAWASGAASTPMPAQAAPQEAPASPEVPPQNS